MSQPQVFEGEGFDEEALHDCLEKLFGKGEFRTAFEKKFERNIWVLYLPRQLTKEEEGHIRQAASKSRDPDHGPRGSLKDLAPSGSGSNYSLPKLKNLSSRRIITEKFSGASWQPQSISIEAYTPTKTPPRSINHQELLEWSQENNIVSFSPTSEAATDADIPQLVTFDIGTSPLIGIVFHSQGHDKVAEGLYGTQIESEEITTFFNMEGFAFSLPSTEKSPHKLKFTIKCMHQDPAEYIELKPLQFMESLKHPNIAEILSVFAGQRVGEPDLMFALPLTLGTLEQLFQGKFDSMDDLSSRRSSLWPQLNGLASAVAYVHEASYVLTDIGTSTVLVYIDEHTEEWTLKLASFSIRVHHHERRVRQHNTPLMMAVFGIDGLRGTMKPLSKMVLLGDVCHLGYVFLELSTFIVDGSDGIREFRDSLATTSDINKPENTSSRHKHKEETLHYIHYYKVQSQFLISSVEALSTRSIEVARIQPTLLDMMADGDARLNARSVCQSLAQQIKIPGDLHHDGVRLVTLEPGRGETRPLVIDHLRVWIQRLTRLQIDWSPLPPMTEPCLEGEMRVHWQYGKGMVSVTLSPDEAERYKSYCLPTFRNEMPLLPTSRNNVSGVPIAPLPGLNDWEEPDFLRFRLRHEAGPSSTPGNKATESEPETTLVSKEIYWCIDRLFSEPKQTMRQPISLLRASTDDEFYSRTKEVFYRAGSQISKGWLSKLSWIFDRLSWKVCVGVDFTQFYIIRTGYDQILLGEVGLPPQGQSDSTPGEYEHGIDPPDDIQMKLVAAQIVFGLRNPDLVHGQTEMISLLPKKKVPPDFKKTMRTMGWGMHAKMGLSARKIFWWLLSCLFFLLVSATPWLLWVDRYDLQNAFVPGGTVLAIFTAAVAIAQVLS